MYYTCIYFLAENRCRTGAAEQSCSCHLLAEQNFIRQKSQGVRIHQFLSFPTARDPHPHTELCSLQSLASGPSVTKRDLCGAKLYHNNPEILGAAYSRLDFAEFL